MKNFLSRLAVPVNVFHVFGSPCCRDMPNKTQRPTLSLYFMVFDAVSIYESNAILVWGSVTEKLALTLHATLPFCPDPRVVVHVRGCERRLDNHVTKSSLNTVLPITSVISSCDLHRDVAPKFLQGIRKCLVV